MHPFLLGCQCKLFILSCLRVSEYISGNSTEKLTKLAFRHPPHNGFVLLHFPHWCGSNAWPQLAHAGGEQENPDASQ